ncbi:alpha/beta fold hydrolase [Nocardia gipuzkoensis]|uniref:alpha/beta fold hydrolase n=1 Tax=Nocardia gipuzkoensis TaxID=2749991 RepID=UPI003EDED902
MSSGDRHDVASADALGPLDWHAMEEGAGPPLILLHGVGDSSRAWDPVIPHLARTRRVIAFDLPGFGRTPDVAGAPSTPKTFAALLPAALAARGISGPVAVVGNSWAVGRH